MGFYMVEKTVEHRENGRSWTGGSLPCHMPTHLSSTDDQRVFYHMQLALLRPKVKGTYHCISPHHKTVLMFQHFLNYQLSLKSESH